MTGAVGRSWWRETRPRSQTEVQTAFLCRLKVSKHRLMQITKLRFRPAYTGRCSVPPNRKCGGRQALGLVKRLVRLLRTQGLPISLSAGPRSSTALIWFPLLVLAAKESQAVCTPSFLSRGRPTGFLWHSLKARELFSNLPPPLDFPILEPITAGKWVGVPTDQSDPVLRPGRSR